MADSPGIVILQVAQSHGLTIGSVVSCASGQFVPLC